MRKVQPYRFVPQTSYSVEQFGRWSRGSGFPPPEPLFFANSSPPRKRGSGEFHICHDGVRVQPCVYVEFHLTMADAIVREKRIKKWRRAWKITVIEEGNPDWRDLYGEIQ